MFPPKKKIPNLYFQRGSHNTYFSTKTTFSPELLCICSEKMKKNSNIDFHNLFRRFHILKFQKPFWSLKSSKNFGFPAVLKLCKKLQFSTKKCPFQRIYTFFTVKTYLTWFLFKLFIFDVRNMTTFFMYPVFTSFTNSMSFYNIFSIYLAAVIWPRVKVNFW